MNDVIAELLSSAKDALERGFAILGVMPSGKDPLVFFNNKSYFPSAVLSASTNPKIALLPWIDGIPANYGVACGQSNLTVVDCDHGLNSEEEFEAWCLEHKIPKTFTVVSGRSDGFGVHLYYQGAVPTTSFNVGGVTGELKSLGGYVVGPGSIHPNGKKYTILHDVMTVPLPPGFATLADKKTKSQALPATAGGKLVPIGNRWGELQSKAGSLRNIGLDEKGIYDALKNFCANNCEDGANYPDNKIVDLAHAALTKFDASVSHGHITFKENPGEKHTIPEAPTEIIEGDWISDLTHELTDGTFIPPIFVRSTLKTILGAALDDLVGFHGYEDIHMRQWNMLISTHPESGKSESWKRCAVWSLPPYITHTKLNSTLSGWFSSGEHMVKKLMDYENQKTVTYFDEMKTLFDKGAAMGSTLFDKLNELYDGTACSASSLTHVGGSFENVGVNFSGNFTASSFKAAFAGRGQGGSGFLSRCSLSYSNGLDYFGDWKAIDTAAIGDIVLKMRDRWIELEAQHIPKTSTIPEHRFIPKETPEASALRLEFEKWLLTENEKDTEESGSDYISRLGAQFKRDLLLRTVFSNDQTITAEKVKRSILWAKHELMLRRELWPVDSGNPVDQMCAYIRRAFKPKDGDTKDLGKRTKRQIQRHCNIARSGKYEDFNRAWSAMIKGGAFIVVGTTNKKTDVLILQENKKLEN